MKSLNLKIAFFFVVYLLLALLGVFLFSYTQQIPPVIIESFLTAYKANNIFLHYFTLFPALLVSGILVAYSWYFSRTASEDDEDETQPKNSRDVMFVYLKEVFITILVGLILFIAADELARPMLQKRQVSMENASSDYRDFSEDAKKSIAAGQYGLAKLYIQQALRINPKSEEMQLLLSDCEIMENRISSSNANIKNDEKPEEGNIIRTNVPVYEMVEKARKLYEKNDFFGAHYYGTLALKASNLENIDLSDIPAIVSDSWEQLQKADITLGGESESIYARKKAGYGAILAEDYIRSYYIFRSLLNESGNNPDVSRYLEISRENLLKTHFFIDETENLQPFEFTRNVYFSVKRLDGGLIVVGIKGISQVKEGGEYVRYLRGVHIVSYDGYRNMEENYYVPYAKCLAQRVDDLPPGYEPVVEKSRKKSVPYLIITSVDRDSEFVRVDPVYYVSKSAVDSAKTVLVLPLPFTDFLKIIDSGQGVENMPLDSLFLFCRKSALYGFSSDSYLDALFNRLCTPFLFVICALFASLLSWRYKLSRKQLVHFWWLLLVPFFTVAAYFLLEFVKFLQGLFVFALTGVLGFVTLPIMIGIYIILFIVLCFCFLSLKKE